MAYTAERTNVFLKSKGDEPPGLKRGSPADLVQTAASLRQGMLDDLRARIRNIERGASMASPGEPALPALRPEERLQLPREAENPSLPQNRGPESGLRWRLGAPEIDALLGPGGLEIDGVHEVKPATQPQGASWAAAWAAALIFTLALGIRRCGLDSAKARRPILFCRPAALAGELGELYGPGLRTLGIAPSRLIIVETGNAADTLWAMEEGLRSGSLALVLGILDQVALTPARRLALAAAAHRSPCLLLTNPRVEGTAATATRWRVGPLSSAPHPFDPRAPGASRFTVALERCRTLPASAATASFGLEWCDEALCFRLAPGVADRADAARRSGRGAQ